MSSSSVPLEPLRLSANADLREHAKAWVTSDALRELVVAFGGDPPSDDEPLANTLANLDEFSERWDFRAGNERNLTGVQALGDVATDFVEERVVQLGQRDLRLPTSTDWDHVLVLGGLVRACFSRTAFLAQLLHEGRLEVRHITCLGAFRPLNAAEISLVEPLLERVPVDEIDAMQQGAFGAFEFDGLLHVRGEQRARPELSWEVRSTSPGTLPWLLDVVAAPAPRPGRRAATPDALAWFARTSELARETSVLIITTEIYRHYHLLDAYRTIALPFGTRVDCVGMEPGSVIAELTYEFTTASRLQEIRSSIRSLRALIDQLESQT